MNDEQPATPPRVPIRIQRWSRWASGLIGLAGLGAGGTATFTRDVEAGPVALIGAGSLFLIVSLAGALPTRIKIGDNEAEFQQIVTDVVTTLAISADPSRLNEVNGALDQLDHVSPAITEPARRALRDDLLVLSVIDDVVERIPGLMLSGIGSSYPVEVRGPARQVVSIYWLPKAAPSNAIDALEEEYKAVRDWSGQYKAGVVISVGIRPKVVRRADWYELTIARGYDNVEFERVLIDAFELDQSSGDAFGSRTER